MTVLLTESGAATTSKSLSPVPPFFVPHFLECFGLQFYSSPEHEVLMVSYCDSAVSGVRRPSCVVRRASSVVNFLPCVCSRGHIFSRILMKVGQDVCLDDISDEFENGSHGVKN